jgi:hypothetical protein
MDKPNLSSKAEVTIGVKDVGQQAFYTDARESNSLSFKRQAVVVKSADMIVMLGP